jgi:hypothetical protein
MTTIESKGLTTCLIPSIIVQTMIRLTFRKTMIQSISQAILTEPLAKND